MLKRLALSGRRRPGSPILFAITMIAAVLIGWGNDYNSCLRTAATRKALTTFFQGQASRALERAQVVDSIPTAVMLDLLAYRRATQAAAELRTPQCLAIFPPTSADQ